MEAAKHYVMHLGLSCFGKYDLVMVSPKYFIVSAMYLQSQFFAMFYDTSLNFKCKEELFYFMPMHLKYFCTFDLVVIIADCSNFLTVFPEI